LVSWRRPIGGSGKTGAINLIYDKSLIALNLIDMKKLILLLTAVFGLGVVAQAADPAASPSASGAPKKHHHHHKASTGSPAAKPSASPKATASPKA
jgi:hypothetical protein